eukprot:COSAG01_NODE_1598_length_9772_cov_8.388671_5_plen_118_part_00
MGFAAPPVARLAVLLSPLGGRDKCVALLCTPACKDRSWLGCVAMHDALQARMEIELRGQLAAYTEKFEGFQDTLTSSNEMFGSLKKEMDKMNRKIKVRSWCSADTNGSVVVSVVVIS